MKLSAQPNAGRPREIEGRNIYLCSPEYMASYARRFINSGVRLVGGCCGTTPDHIRAHQDGGALAGARRARPGAGARRAGAGAGRRPPCRPVVPRGQKSRMANALARGGFVVERRAGAAARLPDRRADRAGAAAEASAAWTSSTFPDGPRASARMSALSAAVLVQQQAGVETDPPLRLPRSEPARACSRICSARTRWACATCCVVTGDPPQVGDYPDATAVVRRRLDRPDQRRAPAESAGSTSAASRSASPTALSHRRGRESRRAEPRRGAAALRATRSRRARSSRSPSRCSMSPELHAFLERVAAPRDSDPRRHHAARERAPRRVHGQRGARACAFPTPSSSGCAGRTPTAAPRRKGWPSRARSRLRFAPWSRASRFRQRRGHRMARASSSGRG